MVEREVRLARVETLRAAVAAAVNCPGAGTADLVRHRYALQLQRAEEDFGSAGVAAPGGAIPASAAAGAADRAHERDDDAAVVRAATEAQRRRLVALRADGTIGDAAFQQVQESLDLAEMDWEQLVRG